MTAIKRLIVFFLTTITISTFAQKHFIGITGGVNITNVFVDNFPDDTNDGTRTNIGLSAGVNYSLLLKEKFLLCSDIIYNRRGFSYSVYLQDYVPSEKGTATFHYDYISIPVKAGLIFGKKFHAYGNIGVIPSLLVKASMELPDIQQQIAYGNEEPLKQDITDQTRKFDLAILTEVGGGYELNKYLLFTSITIQQSLTTIIDTPNYSDGKVKHQGLTFAFGVKYRLN